MKHELKEVLKYMDRKFGATTQSSQDRDGQILLALETIIDVAQHRALVDNSYLLHGELLIKY